MLSAFGFANEELPSVCISFDKLDKIGVDGVSNELTEKGYDKSAIEKLSDVLSKLPLTLDKVTEIVGEETTARLSKIINASREIANGNYGVEFDISLVRGQGYYTGTVFEVRSENFGSSVAGGGRYDNLIGKFIGENIPACGFSIGFERIFSILIEQKRAVSSKNKIAIFYEDNFSDVYAKAEELRKEYDVAIFKKPKKQGAFLNRLQTSGFVGFAYADGNVKLFEK